MGRKQAAAGAAMDAAAGWVTAAGDGRQGIETAVEFFLFEMAMVSRIHLASDAEKGATLTTSSGVTISAPFGAVWEAVPGCGGCGEGAPDEKKVTRKKMN